MQQETSGLSTLIHLLTIGGPIVWILASMSVMALTLFLLKLFQFIQTGALKTASIETAIAQWQSAQDPKAIQQLPEKHPIAKLLKVAVKLQPRYAQDEANVTQEVNRIAQSQLHRFRSLLRPMEIIASLAPLLGLLGTVLGMIHAFQQMELAGSQVNPSVLSGGIWQALLTTAVGLGVAIPTVAAHAWLERQVDTLGHRMNDAVVRVLTHSTLSV